MEITTIFHVIFMKNIKYKPWAIDGKLANLSTYRIGIWYSGVLITITRQRFIRSCINACAYIHDYAKKETINVRSHPSYRFLAFTSSFLEGSFRLRLDNVKKKTKNDEQRTCSCTTKATCWMRKTRWFCLPFNFRRFCSYERFNNPRKLNQVVSNTFSSWKICYKLLRVPSKNTALIKKSDSTTNCFISWDTKFI